MAMSKAAMQRLVKSEFFHEIRNVVAAWDYYLTIRDQEQADAMAEKWCMAKLALEHITGNLYGFSRNDETYSIVNERDYNERLILETSAANMDALLTGEKIRTPRGTFAVVSPSYNEMRERGFSLHFEEEGYYIMNKNNRGCAVFLLIF